MKKVSPKQAAINRELKIVFREVLIEYDGRCTGCDGNKQLTLSHIIRRSKRPDLITTKENIKPHCVRCHNLWDSGDLFEMMKLKDFEDNLRYIFNTDREYYERLKLRALDKAQ